MLDHALQLGVEALRVLGLGVDNLLVDVHWVVINKRSVSGVHLVHEDTEGPPIDGLAVASVEEDLRGDVLGGTANGVGSLLHDLSKAIVDKLEVTINANHNILGLKISVDDILGMQVLEDRSDLGTVELSLLGVEVSNSTVIGEEITTREQLSSEVDVTVVLEISVVAESKRMVNSLEDELLVLNVIHMLAVDDLSLLHRLDSVLLVGLSLQPADLHVSEGTFSKPVSETKVFCLLAIKDAFSLGSHSLNSVSLTLFNHIKRVRFKT